MPMALRTAMKGLAALAMALSAPVAIAAPDISKIDLAAERQAIEHFQSYDQRLQDIGWKLVTTNAVFCDNPVPAIGLQLQDMASYGEPGIARAALSISGDFAVQTAAKGSPAALSGHFPANREVSRIGALDPNTRPAGKRMDWERLEWVHDHIDAELSRAGFVQLAFPNGEPVMLKAIPACRTRFTLESGSSRAVASGEVVLLGTSFRAFSYEEPLLAAAIAHELAHNLLGHRVWLEARGEKKRDVRKAEREADRLMPWLLANAGYDPSAAIRFIERYKPDTGGVLFVKGTHDSWKSRAAKIREELPLVNQAMEAHGKADWRTGFSREIGPQT